ncbi:MAG: glycosyltransferase family 39 protein, partial [Acidobacteriota bacterium]
MELRQNQSTVSWPALVFVVWSLGLLSLFWTLDPTENILLQESQSLWQVPVWGSAGLITSIGGLLLAALIVISWFGLGSQLIRLLPLERDAGLPVSSRFALGAGGSSLILFFIGLAGWYNSWTAWLLLSLGVGGVALEWVRHGRAGSPGATPKSEPMEIGSWILSAILVVVLLTTLIGALAPPIARDSLLYHLSVPKAYATSHALVELPDNLMSYTPLSIELQFLWAMLAGGTEAGGTGERAAGVLGAALGILSCFLVWEWTRNLRLKRFWCLAAVAAIATVPTSWAVATSAYVDLAVAFYGALAIEGMARWWESLERGWLMRVAVFIGFALASKFTILYLAAPMVLVVLLRLRLVTDGSKRQTILKEVAVALVLTCGVAGPWYLRNWWLSGSPLFPFFLNLWPAHVSTWDLERSLLYNDWMLQYGQQPRNILTSLAAPIRLSLAGKIDSYSNYDGVLGVFFLTGLPLIVAARRHLPSGLKVAGGLSLAVLVSWIFSSQQLRYLLPALPSTAVCIVCAAQRWTVTSAARRNETLLGAAVLAIFLSNLLIVGGLFQSRSPTAVVLGSEPREEYLGRHLAYYSLYQMANATLPADSRIWLVNLRNDTYYLERPSFSDDFFEHWTLVQLITESSNVKELTEKVKTLGVTHLMVRYPLFLDLEHSPLVDPSRPQESQRRLTLFKDFLFGQGGILQGNLNFVFVKLS